MSAELERAARQAERDDLLTLITECGQPHPWLTLNAAIRSQGNA